MVLRGRTLAVSMGVVLLGVGAQAGTLLDDPLHNSTTGTRAGGSFPTGGWTGGGWAVGDGSGDIYNAIYWHIASTPAGAFDYYVSGLHHDSCPGGLASKNELSHMYDWMHAPGGVSSDINYDGYRDGPYKQFIRKQCETNKENSLELVWKIDPQFTGDPARGLEEDSGGLNWSRYNNYHFRTEWQPVGNQTELRIIRNGTLVKSQTVLGVWNPAGHSVRIAASPRRQGEGAPLGAVYSNVRVFDWTTPPLAPAVTDPVGGQTINTGVVFIRWRGEPHSRYQVRVNKVNTPEPTNATDISWDSYDTVSAKSFAYTGVLPENGTYYAFVRVANINGYGPWSEGRSFILNTGFVSPGTDIPQVLGSALVQKSGAFLGQGATYMSALRFCRNEPSRYLADLQSLASRNFNYIRILSMVAWSGKEILPSWPDYDQKFRDMLDQAYSLGIRTEIVCFADAEASMNHDARVAHINRILSIIKTPDAANPNGREHKVILIEVANEHYQNGVSNDELYEYAAQLKNGTSVPVALSSPADTSDAGINELYGGSPADITTVHFRREGGWISAMDSYRTGVTEDVAPLNSNEPVGPGSSVNTDFDPLKLAMSAAIAWAANLPMYVFHCGAGTFADNNFEYYAGSLIGFSSLRQILPGDLAGWVRNDGVEDGAPFTSSGVYRNIGATKGDEFVALPIGIAQTGARLVARRDMSFQICDVLTGQISAPIALQAGRSYTLNQGATYHVPGPHPADLPTDAFIIKGRFTSPPKPSLVCFSEPFDYSNGQLNGNDGWGGTAGSEIELTNKMVRITGGSPQTYVQRNVFCQDTGSGFIRVSLWIRSGVGSATMWSLWCDDPTGKNLARWYGSGTTARGRIGDESIVTNPQTLTGGWDHLVVKIYPATNISEFYLNRVLIGSLSHGITGASDVLGRIRLERINNSLAAGQYVFLDDLLVGVTPTPGDFDGDEDVDQEDFGYLQECLSDRGLAYMEYCADADLDSDGDVDVDDVPIFQACLSGADVVSPCVE